MASKQIVLNLTEKVDITSAIAGAIRRNTLIVAEATTYGHTDNMEYFGNLIDRQKRMLKMLSAAEVITLQIDEKWGDWDDSQ